MLAAALLLLWPAPGALAAGARPTELFALIVASNHSSDPSVRPLRYADDDAARVYELFSAAASRTELLTVMDDETQRTFAPLVDLARQPTRDELRQAMGRLRQAMLAASEAGARTTFFFYFAGHGHVGRDREGYVSLSDGRLSRSDLFREVIERSPADTNHIVIDACNAYFLVNRRGGGSSRAASADEQRAIRSFLARESLRRYPHTGVVLSTATAAESHEWSRYRSGIFSHQLLSALLGGADIDGDARVTYDELTAYVAAANLRVVNPEARIAIHARPPAANRQAALFDLRQLRRVARDQQRPAPGRLGAFLEVPASLEGHHYLEDDRGVRYLDFNKSAEQPLRLALLDRPYYYLRSEREEALIRLVPVASPAAAQAPGSGAGDSAPFRRLLVSALAFQPTPTRSRGAVEESFRRDLYAFPFGRSFAAGYAARMADEAVDSSDSSILLAPSDRRWYAQVGGWRWVALGTAVAALAVGTTFQALAIDADADLRDGEGKISMAEAVRLQQTARDRRVAAGIAFGVGGTAAVTSLALVLVHRAAPARVASRAEQEPGQRTARLVVPTLHPGGGASIALGGHF